jgi:hypothetical protein
MAKQSSLFIWIIVVLVAVVFVMVAGQVIIRTPTGGNYSVTGTPENATTQLIVGSISNAPNYMIPAIFVMLAIVFIGLLFLVKKRSG